jgi:hypothetical protein
MPVSALHNPLQKVQKMWQRSLDGNKRSTPGSEIEHGLKLIDQ